MIYVENFNIRIKYYIEVSESGMIWLNDEAHL